MLKLYDCDIGITIDGVRYDFEHVDSVTVDDPERRRLVRGANAGNKTGLNYREGVKDAKTLTTSVIAIPPALHALLKTAYDEETRMDVHCISRKNASGKFAKNAILSQRPQQLTLDQSPESLNTALIFESFDVEDVLKEDA